MGAISGWGGALSISTTVSGIFGGGTRLPILGWSITNRVDPLDVTLMGQKGYEDCLSGVTTYDLSFECLYDTTLNPFLAIPNLNPGEAEDFASSSNTYYTASFFMDKTATDGRRGYKFPRIMLLEVTLTDEVKGMVKYSVSAKSSRSGTYEIGQDVTRGPVPDKPFGSPG